MKKDSENENISVLLRGSIQTVGKREAVGLFLDDGEYGGLIILSTPILREDIKNGDVLPRATAKRHKSQIVTTIDLPNRALKALKALLNEQEHI